MAGYLTTFGANSLLDGDTMPATLWIKGHIGNPGVNALSSPGVEDRRLSFTRSAAVAGSCHNDNLPVLYDATTSESWTHLSLWDDSSAGNPWWIVPLNTPLAVIVHANILLAADLLVLSFVLWS